MTMLFDVVIRVILGFAIIANFLAGIVLLTMSVARLRKGDGDMRIWFNIFQVIIVFVICILITYSVYIGG